jgi:prepilin-type processing-associated H-X9-DG protein
LEISTNASITWTAARHNNWGNIVRADGFAESTSSSTFQQMLVETGVATNRLAIP